MLAEQWPGSTRTYFAEHLLCCGQINTNMDILAKVVRGLKDSTSMEVALLCGSAKWDIRPVTESSIVLVTLETGMYSLH